MKRIIILAAALSLAGCSVTTKELAASSIETICTTFPQADFAFQQVVATGRVSKDIVDKERAAVVALDALCQNPPKDTKTAIASATRILTALLTAAAQARKQAGV